MVWATSLIRFIILRKYAMNVMEMEYNMTYIDEKYDNFIWKCFNDSNENFNFCYKVGDKYHSIEHIPTNYPQTSVVIGNYDGAKEIHDTLQEINWEFTLDRFDEEKK